MLVVLLSATALTPWDAFGQTTTWIGTVGSPTGDRWGVNANWSSNTPTPSGTAVFGGSAVTTIDFSDNVNGIIFGTLQLNAGAPSYTFQTANSEPQLQGLGIVNNSVNVPIFQLSQNAVLTFSNSASAANANFTLVQFGGMNFFRFQLCCEFDDQRYTWPSQLPQQQLRCQRRHHERWRLPAFLRYEHGGQCHYR